jgi:hypothetical protein
MIVASKDTRISVGSSCWPLHQALRGLSSPLAFLLLLPAVLDPLTDHPLGGGSKSDRGFIRSAPAGRTSRNFEGRAFRIAIGSFIARHPDVSGDLTEGDVC